MFRLIMFNSKHYHRSYVESFTEKQGLTPELNGTNTSETHIGNPNNFFQITQIN